ncbi:MAG: hypothetical protein ACLQSR_04350 [Limisphaerales bacterium]
MFAEVAPAAQSLARRLENGGACSFSGVTSSAQPFFAALLHRLFPSRPIVVVTENLKTQEIFHQDLETWLGASPLFYPEWEVFPHENKLPHVDIVSDRLQTLIALSENSKLKIQNQKLIVTNIAALLQKTFAPDDLINRARHLQRGDKIAPLDLIEWLEEQGYEPEAQVSQKGEIALRGGIVDLFPPTSPWPVRLEFFGDELESLREVDPLTQISRETISEITIPPAGEIGILKRLLNAGNEPTIESQNPPHPAGHSSDLSPSPAIPKGLPSFSPGLRGTSYPGKTSPNSSTLKGLNQCPDETPPKNSRLVPQNLPHPVGHSSDSPHPPPLPSPLPSDGRGEGQGEVRVPGVHGELQPPRMDAHRGHEPQVFPGPTIVASLSPQRGENSPNDSRLAPLNLPHPAGHSSDSGHSLALPSPLPSDGRGEGQGEVRVPRVQGEGLRVRGENYIRPPFLSLEVHGKMENIQHRMGESGVRPVPRQPPHSKTAGVGGGHGQAPRANRKS